ncbi:DUF6993 domain-containing protein [Arthrobacter globiformis]|uniref:DUF6993 domain-containing protein n=1 Tax=Arthrobacter globiformis TaxID=1665 RepID=UPI0027D913CA|nr:hypothetical protein [Arthrobacter globiformis]
MRTTTLQRNKALRGNATGAWGTAKKATGRLALAVVVLSALGACTAPGDPAAVNQTAEGQAAGEQAATQSAASASAKPSVPAAATKGAAGATAALQQTMADVLGGVVAANRKPATAEITSALTAAGVPARNLEVSAGRTPTGLEVDSMEAAAVQAKECVIGQIRDGKVTVTVLPALSNGKCFVGAAG